jgi:hypothetical protein
LCFKATLQTEHLQKVFGSDFQVKDVFAIPTIPEAGSRLPTQFIIFKVVSLSPDRRSYLQRAFALSQDDRTSVCSRDVKCQVGLTTNPACLIDATCLIDDVPSLLSHELMLDWIR